MKFEIRRVQNGAVLRVESEGDDSGEEIVYQEQEDDEIEAFERHQFIPPEDCLS